MSVTHLWAGAVTDTTAWVRGKVTGASVRLVVSRNDDLSAPVYFGPEVPTAEGIASVEATGLTPYRLHHYAFEVDGTVDTTKAGKFRTHPAPATPFSFRIAAASCAGRDAAYDDIAETSNSPIFDTIRGHDPLFFMHMGDMHYKDIATASQALFRSAYDDVLSNARQAQLYREVPIVYMWDDHDAAGGNNGHGTSTGRDEACLTYRERVPHYPLPAGAGANPTYQSFTVGRVLFIVTDLRASRSPDAATDDASKTMLGATQKAWLFDLFANEAQTAALVVWVTTSPPICSSGAAAGERTDTWGNYSTERAEIAAEIAANTLAPKMLMLSGDIHALAMDDGTNNEFGDIPVCHFATMDSSLNSRGGPYTQGPLQGTGQYGVVHFDDLGSDVGIRVRARGYRDSTIKQHMTIDYPSGLTTDRVVRKRRTAGAWV